MHLVTVLSRLAVFLIGKNQMGMSYQRLAFKGLALRKAIKDLALRVLPWNAERHWTGRSCPCSLSNPQLLSQQMQPRKALHLRVPAKAQAVSQRGC